MTFPPLRPVAVAALLGLAASGSAFAQASDYPNRPIKIVVGFGPGVGMEVSTRLVGELLAKEIGQPVLIENKAGASTMIAAQQVAAAPKDGYTVLMWNNQTANNQLLFKSVPYKNSDFVPVAGGGIVSMVLAVSKQFPVKTGRELLDYARANPGKLNYAYWGAGGSPQLLAARMEATTGVKLTGVGYKEPAQATTDLAAGRVQMFFTSATQGLGMVNAGQANIVAVGTARRMANLPDVPTFVESGIEGMPNPWWGYAVPTGTPQPVIDKLAAAIRAAVAQPRYQQMLVTTGSAPLPADSPAAFQQWITQDLERWAAAIRPLKLQLD